MTQEDHFDVASYALGVLDEHDAARFEDHLIECSRCAHELESFVEVADLLADVDANSVVVAEEARRDGFMLQKVIGEVSHERHRANSRRLYSLAAAVVIFAMLSIGAFFVGGQVFGGESKDPATTNTAQRDESQQDPLPNAQGGPGIGGPDLAGERFDGSDPRSGVQASVAFEKKTFGTQVSFAISNITGPKVCRLVAVHTNGTTEPLATWTVGENGWGTAKNSEPLLLQAITATPRDEIAHVQVQEIGANGAGETLVRVP